MKYNLVMTALLALLLMTAWRLLRALGIEPVQLLAALALGIGSGVMTGSIVLFVGSVKGGA